MKHGWINLPYTPVELLGNTAAQHATNGIGNLSYRPDLSKIALGLGRRKRIHDCPCVAGRVAIIARPRTAIPPTGGRGPHRNLVHSSATNQIIICFGRPAHYAVASILPRYSLEGWRGMIKACTRVQGQSFGGANGCGAGRPGPQRCSDAPSRARLAGPRRTPWFNDPRQPRRVRALVAVQDRRRRQQAPGHSRVSRPQAGAGPPPCAPSA